MAFLLHAAALILSVSSNLGSTVKSRHFLKFHFILNVSWAQTFLEATTAPGGQPVAFSLALKSPFALVRSPTTCCPAHVANQ